MNKMAGLDPDMPVRAARFDFLAPDLASLDKPIEHTVVFTVSSLHLM